MEEAGGSPKWMATFADLMSLLMCFFVLLLSFSEIDAQKYKLIAGYMKNAFGVQQERIALKDPSGIDETVQINPDQALDPKPAEELTEEEKMAQIQELVMETRRDVENLEDSLDKEIRGGQLDIESGFRSITIRIKEKGSFGSGSADLQPEFIDVLDKVRDLVKDIEGRISVEGHTDNIDIKTSAFPSNWSLSSARALSVAHALMENEVIPHERFLIVGHADTLPVDTNDTAEGRSANRRVELVIRQEISEEVAKSIREFSDSNPEFLDSLEAGEPVLEPSPPAP